MMISATYFFFRHNSHCEPYIYTLFALSEYIIVLSNIYFHSLAYYDLGNLYFAIISDGRKESQMSWEIAWHAYIKPHEKERQLQSEIAAEHKCTLCELGQSE